MTDKSEAHPISEEDKIQKAIEKCNEKIIEAKNEKKQGYRDDTLSLLTQMITDYSEMKSYLQQLKDQP